MEGDAIGVLLRGARHGRTEGIAKLLGPALPAGAEALGQDHEDRPTLERGTALRAPGVERRAIGPRCPDPFERIHLERRHRRTVDPTLGVQGAAGRRQLGELVADALGAGNLLDPQVQRAPETSGARVVRAGLRLRSRVRRTERPDGHEACPCRCRPRTELPQVGQVADSPAAPRARGCQLNRPAPRPQTCREVATAGAGDDQLLAAVVAREPVIAVWRVDGHRVDAAQA